MRTGIEMRYDRNAKTEAPPAPCLLPTRGEPIARFQFQIFSRSAEERRRIRGDVRAFVNISKIYPEDAQAVNTKYT
jgi:hypothetical protein